MGEECLIVTGDFVCTGGMDRANFALANYLLRQGYRVHLVAHRVAESLLRYPNAVLHQVPKPRNSYLLGSPLLDWVGRSVAAQVLSRGGRVLVNGANCWVPQAANWVHYVHHAYAPDGGHGWRRWKAQILHQQNCRAERRAFELATLLVANSYRTQQDVIQFFGRSPEHIPVVYLGIDAVQFAPMGAEERQRRRQELGWDRPTLLFIGNPNDPRKGFERLLAAWTRVCQSPGWDAQLVVVGGSGEMRGDRLLGLGFRNDVPRLLPAADGLVSPTRYESYGMGVHEALCCGIPAIVTQEAGVAERYPEALGDFLLQNPRDDGELAVKLRRWREGIPGDRQIVAALSEQLRQHTWDHMAAEIDSLWQ